MVSLFGMRGKKGKVSRIGNTCSEIQTSFAKERLFPKSLLRGWGQVLAKGKGRKRLWQISEYLIMVQVMDSPINHSEKHL